MLATAAAAQDRISAQAFLDRVAGQSVSFYSAAYGHLVGVERFEGRDQVIWQPRDRDCVRGQVSVRNDLVCFEFPELGDTEPACWAAFARGGDLVVVNQDRWEGMTQIVRFEGRAPNC
ncbi:MAG: hypothetical protein AAFN94_15670 [Pseudomonadota bacterium]